MIVIKKIKPTFTGVVTTMNKYDSDVTVAGTAILDVSKIDTVKEYQTVVAVGSSVRGIEVGDTVFINPKRYAVMQHKEGALVDGVIKDNPVVNYRFDIVELEGVPHLYLQDGDIKYVAEIEEIPDEKPSTLVADTKPSIIV